MPVLLHRDPDGKRFGSCARRTELTDAAQTKAEAEMWKSWSYLERKWSL